MPLTLQDFISKWKRITVREKQTCQEHFLDLCHLVGHQTPNEYDHNIFGRLLIFDGEASILLSA